MTRRHSQAAVVRAAFADELLARLARTAARRALFKKAATGATATASLALLVATKRRVR